jgi:subtilase family serine protease
MHRATIRRSRTFSKPASRSLRRKPWLEQLETRNLLATVAGFSPAQELAAYGFNQLALSQPGLGKTIAIVDAYIAPNITTDLTTFDTKFGLPTINLTVIPDGATRSDPSGGWELETALDVEWAHAVAPYAKIVLVEAANDAVNSTDVPTALLHSVSLAASSTVGANVVSMSWGLPEFKAETSYDSTFNVPGVTFVASAGDNGAGTIWPAVSPNVVSVGGTTLTATSTSGVYTETAWNGGGGGVSTYESAPAYQGSSFIDSELTLQVSSAKRTSPDVSFLANPNTGVAVYDSGDGGWFVVGGTSAGAPQIAATVALADQLGKTSLSSAQTLAATYSEQADFYDITSGTNGYAAGTGYDLASGLGSPIANLCVPALAKQAAAHGVNSTDALRAAPISVGGGFGNGFGGFGSGHHHGDGGHGFRDDNTTDNTSSQFFIISLNFNSSLSALSVLAANSAATAAQQSAAVLAVGQSFTYQIAPRAYEAALITPPSLRVGETIDDPVDGGQQVLPPLPAPVPGGGQQPLAAPVNNNVNRPAAPQTPRNVVPDQGGSEELSLSIWENEAESVSEHSPTALAAVFAALGFMSFKAPAEELDRERQADAVTTKQRK